MADRVRTERATVPGPTLSVHIENHEAGERAFDATLGLHEGYARVAGKYARFDAGRFDTVVATLVLCTIPEPARGGGALRAGVSRRAV